ncbi:MAG: CoB--CoM heterodisulfide reductase iron-sulfur subunit B family protein [Rhodobacterales bacterium]|nr:CoB--CoM heterodisulfide reductase iron-sulfur subunit B family protein [Rhodobacterales bacterium]
MSKKYTYYPGCSSEGSGSHLDISLRAIAPKLGVELEDLNDWNCCGASVTHVEAGALPTAALSARNLANAQKQGNAEVVTSCAACYLKTHQTNEKVRDKPGFKDKINEALGAAGMSYDGELHVRHACEVIVNDVGLDKVREQVTKPLTGLKVAPYVGCQTVRPFAGTDRGGEYDTYDDPEFLDDFIEACGAEAVEYDAKTACCGGAVSLMSPDKTLGLMKKILDEAKEKQADVIATPCPLCQQNVEMYQAQVNEKFGTDHNIPVVFYSQLMAVAFGMDPDKDGCLDRNTISADVVKQKAGG